MNLEVIGYEGIYDKNVHYITINGIPEGSTIKYSSNNNIYVSYKVGFDIPGTFRVYYEIYNPNYYLAQGSETIVISKKPVTVSGIKAIDKDYDGTTAATLDYSDVVVDGVYEGHSVIVEATASFIDANAGENKEVAISNFIIVGGDFCPFYEIAETGNQETTTATINKVDMPEFVVSSYVGTYDRFSHRISISGYPENSTVKYSDDNEYYSTSNPGFMNAGTHTVYYRVEHTNYKTVEGTSTVVINKRLVTVSGIKANNKVYDGTTSVTLDLSDVLKDGLYSGDSIGLAISASFENPNVGNNKLVNITMALNGTSYNYDLDVDNSQHYAYANITKNTMTDISVTGFYGVYDKEYHRIDVTGYPEGATISYSLDDIVYSSSNPEYINAGTYLVYFMVDCENYERYKGSETIIINKKDVIVSGITASNKDFDNNTSATLDYTNVVFNGLISGDSLEVSATGEFEDYNAGSNKTVYIYNITLGGSSISNYILAEVGNQETTAATINKIDMNVTATGYEATYDKDIHGIAIGGYPTNSTISYSEDNETYSTTRPEYMNAGTYVVYYRIENANYNTYEGSETVIINKKIITVSGIKVKNKEYDGTTSADLIFDEIVYDGLIEGDDLSLVISVAFEDANYGTNKIVNITNLVISYGSNNYELDLENSQHVAYASITKIIMNDISVTGYEGTYDRVAHSITVTGYPEGSTITYSTSETIPSTTNPEFTNIGSYTVYFIIECDNYESFEGSETIIIESKKVTVSGIIANDKDYDGNTSATLDYTNVVINGLIEGDELVVLATGTFDNSNAGNYKTVYISNISLSGSSVINYDLDLLGNQSTTKASINKIDMNLTVTGYNGDYDKEIHKVIINGAPDNSTINYSIDGITYSTTNPEFINAGTYNVYYNIYNPNYNNVVGIETIVINNRAITVSGIKALNKVYDGNTSVELDLSDLVILGKQLDDDLDITFDAAFVDSNYGYDKVVNLTNIVLVGESKNNYVLNLEDSQKVAYASITKLLMNVVATGYEGTYDKEAHSLTITGYPDGSTVSYSTDGVVYVALNPEYINAGSYKVYFMVECNNYERFEGFETIIINKKEVTVSGIKASNKVYDGNTAATLNYDDMVIAGVISGDTLEVSATGAFDNKNVGTNKVVSISNITISDTTNYELATTSLEANATISAKEIIISNIKALDKKYDKTTDATLDCSEAVLDGLVSGDTLTISANGSFKDAKSGKNKEVEITSLDLEGADSANYVIKLEASQTVATATIIKPKSNNGGAIAGVIIALIIIGALATGTVIFLKKRKDA